MNKALIASIVLCTFWAAPSAFAQSGSTGGSIGKAEKSISGDQAERCARCQAAEAHGSRQQVRRGKQAWIVLPGKDYRAMEVAHGKHDFYRSRRRFHFKWGAEWTLVLLWKLDHDEMEYGDHRLAQTFR